MTQPLRVRLDRRTTILRRGGRVRILGGDPVTLVTPSASAAALLGKSGEVDTSTPAGVAFARALTDRGMAHPQVDAVGGGGDDDGGDDAASTAGGASTAAAAGPARALDSVAVVVPVRDDADGVAALVRAVRPERSRGMGVVVVDDGSAAPLTPVRVDPTSTATTPVVIRHVRARGPAAARNAGTAAAVARGAQVVVYLDADVLPRPGWLDPLLDHLDDPQLAAVAPRVVAAEPGRFWVRGYETARSALDMGVEPALVRPRTRVPYVPSAALAVRPDRLPTPPPGGGAGPFDERLHVAEDVDLCWRVVAAGGRIRFEPAAHVAHRHRTTLGPLLSRRAYYGRGAAPLAERHGPAVAPAVASPWSLAVALGVWSATPLGVGVAVVAAGRAWWRTRALTGDGRAAAQLIARGSGASVRQLPEALLRPYWPVTAAIVLVTAPSGAAWVRALRRRLLVAAVADGVWHWWSVREPGRLPVDEPIGHIVLRRLDDAAYGVGVWRSAWAAGSTGALQPEFRR